MNTTWCVLPMNKRMCPYCTEFIDAYCTWIPIGGCCPWIKDVCLLHEIKIGAYLTKFRQVRIAHEQRMVCIAHEWRTCACCTEFRLVRIAQNSDRCVLHMNKGRCILPMNKGRARVAHNYDWSVFLDTLALIGKMRVEWDETPNIWRLWRSSFLWYFLFYL